MTSSIACCRPATGATACSSPRDGPLMIRNARHARDPRPLDESCACYTCRHFSAARCAISRSRSEMLGAQLATLHNLHFYLRADARDARRTSRRARSPRGRAAPPGRGPEREHRLGAERRGRRAAADLQLGRIVLMFAIFYFLLIRPEQRRRKEHEAQLLATSSATTRSSSAAGSTAASSRSATRWSTVEIAPKVQVQVDRSADRRRVESRSAARGPRKGTGEVVSGIRPVRGRCCSRR